jgi:hypothetical protein
VKSLICLLLAFLVAAAGWFSFLYVAYGPQTLLDNLLAAGVSAVVSLILAVAIR